MGKRALIELHQRLVPLSELQIDFMAGSQQSNFEQVCACGTVMDSRGEVRNAGVDSYWLLAIGICPACASTKAFVCYCVHDPVHGLVLQNETEHPAHPYHYLLKED